MRYPNGHEFEYKMLRPSQIRADPLYQRDLDTKRVDKIVKEFKGDTFNEPKVSYRDGIYWVFDGQHTIEIVALKSGSRETPVWCMIYDDLVYTQEADIFANQQKYTHADNQP